MPSTPDDPTTTTSRTSTTTVGGGQRTVTAPLWVVNAGSSSLKVRTYPSERTYTVGRLGDDVAEWVVDGQRSSVPRVRDVAAAFRTVLDAERRHVEDPAPSYVGHRIVHGGDVFVAPTELDDVVVERLERMVGLAPLHLPPNLAGVSAARSAFPQARHVGVFDTAFHATLPSKAYLYPLPHALYEERGIRRFGFHGTSHDVVSARVAAAIGRDRGSLRIVTLHLGNGASAAAVDRGRCVDTTMGFTPLEGLMMGTRCGDVDPGILLHLLRGGMDVDDLEQLLQRESGLLGLSGRSADVRDVWAAHDEGDRRATAALEVYAHRVRKAVASMAASMGGLDVVAFTGGLGEHDARMRAMVTSGLEFLGVRVDASRNDRAGPRITADGADVETWVVPTDEEGEIARIVLDHLARDVDGAAVEEARS